jgi:hypothetical protein
MLLKIDGEKIALMVIVFGLVVLVGHAQSRFDFCRSVGQKNVRCVLGVR